MKRLKNKITGSIVECRNDLDLGSDWTVIKAGASKPAALDADGEAKPKRASKSMKTDDLVALAEEHGVDISECANNTERADTINAALDADGED